MSDTPTLSIAEAEVELGKMLRVFNGFQKLDGVVTLARQLEQAERETMERVNALKLAAEAAEAELANKTLRVSAANAEADNIISIARTQAAAALDNAERVGASKITAAEARAKEISDLRDRLSEQTGVLSNEIDAKRAALDALKAEIDGYQKRKDAFLASLTSGLNV